MDTEPVDPRDPEAPAASAAPSPEDVRRMLAGVMDPELHASITDLGMVDALEGGEVEADVLGPAAHGVQDERRQHARRVRVDLAGDRFVERSMTDEILYELMQLSGQEYVDTYARRQSQTAAKSEPEPDPVALDEADTGEAEPPAQRAS